MSNNKKASSLFASKAYTIWTIALSVYTDLFLYGFVIILLPALLRERCNVAPDQIQGQISLLLAVFNAMMIVATPLAGYVADRWSNKKRPFLFSLVTLGGATLLFALARQTGVLLVARMLQGISAAIVWSVGLGLLTDTVGKRMVGYAMGWVQLALSLGNVTGPLAGGILYTQAGHIGTFTVAVGLVGVDVIMRLLVVDRTPPKVKHTKEQTGEAIDYRTAPSASPRVAPSDPTEDSPLLSHQPRASVTDQAHSGAAESTLGAILKLLTTPELLYHLVFAFTGLMLQTGYETIIPLHFQSKYGWSSQKTSLAFLPLVLPVFLGPLIGSMHDRYGPTLFYISGLVLAAVSGPTMAVTKGAEPRHIAIELILLALLGLSFVFILTPAMAEVSSFGQRKEEDEQEHTEQRGGTALCCALLNMSLAIGGVAGSLSAGFAMSSAGWPVANFVLGAWPQLWLIVTVVIWLRMYLKAT